jgi:hypothetical protein
MDWYALSTIIAVLLAPLVALRISRYFDESKEIKKRKLAVFTDLMATRSTGLSPKHVEALNRLDVEFYEDDKVKESWKEYLDHLNQTHKIATNDKEGLASWTSKKEDLFASLLDTMAKSLGYKYDKVDLKRRHYYPQAFADIETEQMIIRRGLVQIFLDQKAFPIKPIIPQQEPRQDEKKLNGSVS